MKRTWLFVAAALLPVLVLGAGCDDDDCTKTRVCAGATAGDAADAASDVVDASTRPCDPTKEPGSPVPVLGLSTAEHSELSARFSPNELVVYFVRAGSDGGTSSDIYTGERLSTSQDFSPPRLMPEVGSEGFDWAPTVTADRRGIFFARGPVTGVHIWKATGKTAPFATAEEMPGPINEGSETFSPYVLPDGSAIYLSKILDSAGGTAQIYRAARGDGSFSDVRAVDGLGTDADEALSPVITADELTIYWSARRGGVLTSDIFMATRQLPTMPFSGVHRVAALNTSTREESPTFVSADGCRLYYSSTLLAIPPATNTVSDILVATKPK